MSQPNESPSTNELIESCAKYLHLRFDYQSRMEQVHEHMDAEALTEAIAASHVGNHRVMDALIENTALGLCRRSAAALVKQYGEFWQKFYEGVDYE